MFLNELKAGERAVVRSVGGEGALRQHFLDMGVIPGAEITLETNPDAVTPERLAGFRQAGVNRLSLGVQSARDDQLRRLGRTHTAAGAAAALRTARQAGFTELCGDIMLALPQIGRAHV